MLIDVAPDGWHRPMDDPPGARLRMEVDTVTPGVEDDGQLTGWAWAYGRRLLPEGSKRPGKALVRLSALPPGMKVRHRGAVVEVRELQQTHTHGRAGRRATPKR